MSLLLRFMLSNYFLINVTQIFEIQQETNGSRNLLSQSIIQIMFGVLMTIIVNLINLIPYPNEFKPNIGFHLSQTDFTKLIKSNNAVTTFIRCLKLVLTLHKLQ